MLRGSDDAGSFDIYDAERQPVRDPCKLVELYDQKYFGARQDFVLITTALPLRREQNKRS